MNNILGKVLFLSFLLNLLSSSFVIGQNVITNGNFTLGSTGWYPLSTCVDGVEAYSVQNTYCGDGVNNPVSEIDARTCAGQIVCIMPSTTYTLKYRAAKRTQSGPSNANAGMNITLNGLQTATNYFNKNTGPYSKPILPGSCTWVNETYTIVVPAGFTDKSGDLRFGPYQNTEGSGIVIDDVTLTVANPFALSGPTTIGCSSPQPSYQVVNGPTTAGVSYHWSFGANASPDTITTTNPTATSSFTSTGTYTVSVTMSNGFCSYPFTQSVTVNCVALPVELESFTGVFTTKGNSLNWSTAMERNAAYFEIERSLDAINYDQIGKVSANGNSTIKHYYQFLDTESLSGRAYYRLKQVDFDGKWQYSPTITVEFELGFENALKAYPTLFADELNISILQNPNSVELVLQDALGKELQRMLVKEGKYTFNTDRFSAGIYILKATIDGKEFVQRLIKIE